MQAPFIDEYKGYQLHCAPEARVGGGFAARLQVGHAYGAHRDDYTVDAGAGVFEVQADAAVHARQVGRQWVDERAQPAQVWDLWDNAPLSASPTACASSNGPGKPPT